MEELGAFEELKLKLTSETVLTIPRVVLNYVFGTDVCDTQVMYVLMQKHIDEKEEKVLTPLGYFSRVLNAAEKNYDATHRKYLSMVWVPLLRRPYLQEERFLLLTDHDEL